MKFETRRLGRSAVEVSTFGLGGATLAGNFQPITESEGRTIVIDAFDSGVRYFDTAPFYGYGKSEHVMGDGLRGREGFVLSTKVGRRLKARRKPQEASDAWQRPFPNDFEYDYSYDGVMRSYEDSLQRLGLARIDILLIHDIDVYTHGADLQPKMFKTAMEGAYKALDELRRTGEVRAIGLGVNESQPIADALSHGQWDCFLLAGRYTLLEQDSLASLFPAVEKHGASIIIGGPFNSGVLVGRDTWNYSRAPESVMTRVRAIADICDAHKVPLPVAALKFPLAHPLVASIIPGPRSTGELNQILSWWKTPVPAALWADLKSAKLIAAGAPVPA